MTERSLALRERAADLRRAFDRVFAEAPRSAGASVESFLAVGIGGDTYALRLSEVEGLFTQRAITRLPGSVPAFLGVAGVRGAIVPVYSLDALLSSHASESPRWLALAGKEDRVGLAFERLEGHFRSATNLVNRAADAGESRPHVRAAITSEGRVIPLIDVRSVVQTITRSIPSDRSKRDD